MRFSAVLFDLDGTLLDTLDDLADSANSVLAAHCYPQRTRGEIRQFVGNGVRLLMERALPPETAEGELVRCLDAFRAHYEKNMRNRTKPYDGIPALLGVLQGHGVRMAVISNKFDPAVQDLCRAYFSPWITTAIGERPGVRKKPAPDSVLEAMRILEVDPAVTLYVGDSDVDVETAHRAGIACAGVTWGFRDRALLASVGADYIVDEPQELEAIIFG